MGSGQSTPSENINKGSFSIDSSGKISQPKPKVPKKQQQQSDHQETNQNQSKDPSDSAGAGQQNSSLSDNSDHLENTNPAAGHTTQLSTLNNNMTRSSYDNGLSLQEADEVITRMKAKYKPNSAEMAGQGRGILDEIERKLLYCYKTHKNQPLACAELSKQYQECVRQRRSQTLKESLKPEDPIAA